MSPLNRKLVDRGQPLEQIPPTQNINDLFRMEIDKKVGSDGCVRMWATRFEVRDAYPGEVIRIYYVPWDHTYILCGPDKLIANPLDAIRNARRFDRPIRGKRIADNNNQKKENPS
jgi:hypothetical protein